MTPPAWRPRFAPFVIAGLALLLRSQFVQFPTDAHVDERIVGKLVERAVTTGSLTADWSKIDDDLHSHPTLQFSPYSLTVQFVSLAARSIGGGPRTADEAIRVARWFSVVCGAAAVLTTFFAARAWSSSPTAALIAEVFHAVAFLHVQDSCYARVEAFLSLAVGLALLSAGSIPNSTPSILRCGVLGLSIGLAIAVKYNAAPLLAFVVLPALSKRRVGLIAVVMLSSVIGFAASTPEILTNFSAFKTGLEYEASHYRTGHIPHQAFDGWDFNAGWWIEYLAKLGAGWIPLTLAIAFLLLTSFRADPNWRRFAAFLLLSGTGTALPTVRFERNAEVMLATMCISAGWMLAELRRDWASRWTPRTALLLSAALAAAACTQSGLALWRFRHEERRGASPLHRIPSWLNTSERVWHGNIWQTPPADWPNFDALVLYGRSDRFSKSALGKWLPLLRNHEVKVYDSRWRRWGYPFSTVEVYHGPLYVLTAVRK